MRHPALASLFALAAGCAPAPVTQVVVVVHTSYAVPRSLDRVRITASREGPAETQTSEGPWVDAREPRVLGLVHEGGPLGLTVRVEGLKSRDGGAPSMLVRRDARFDFVGGVASPRPIAVALPSVRWKSVVKSAPSFSRPPISTANTAPLAATPPRSRDRAN